MSTTVSRTELDRTQAQPKPSAGFQLDCPQCGLPAQIVDRFSLGGSAGPVEHVKIVCVAGHWFTPLAESLPLRD